MKARTAKGGLPRETGSAKTDWAFEDGKTHCLRWRLMTPVKNLVPAVCPFDGPLWHKAEMRLLGRVLSD